RGEDLVRVQPDQITPFGDRLRKLLDDHVVDGHPDVVRPVVPARVAEPEVEQQRRLGHVAGQRRHQGRLARAGARGPYGRRHLPGAGGAGADPGGRVVVRRDGLADDLAGLLPEGGRGGNDRSKGPWPRRLSGVAVRGYTETTRRAMNKVERVDAVLAG